MENQEAIGKDDLAKLFEFESVIKEMSSQFQSS